MGTEIEINASGPKPVPLLFTSKQRSPAAAEPLLSPEASAAAIFPIPLEPKIHGKIHGKDGIDPRFQLIKGINISGMKTYENIWKSTSTGGKDLRKYGCSIEASNLKLKPIDKTSCWRGSRCMFHASLEMIKWEPRQKQGIFQSNWQLRRSARSLAPGFNPPGCTLLFCTMPWQP